MDIEYLYGLTKEQLIKLILNQQESKESEKPTPPPRTVTGKPLPRRDIVKIIDTPRSVKDMVKNYEDIIEQPKKFRNKKVLRFDYVLPNHMKRYPRPSRPAPAIPNLVKEYIIQPPITQKTTRKPPQIKAKNYGLNFDDDIIQTENTSLEKFKIISVRSSENKKFKSYKNEFKVKILKKLDDVKEIYQIFQELVMTVKRRRKLSNNDMLRLIIQNEELPKGGFPVMAETTRNHIFSKEISQVIIAAMVLAPNFY